MAMQTDVKSAHLSAAGSYYGDRTRLRGLVVSPKISTAVTFEIRDGSATAAVLYTMDLASNSNPNTFYVIVPGEGILAKTGLYLTLSVGSITGITVFYG
jgi:cytochrome c-type biogenesis protein CcmE